MATIFIDMRTTRPPPEPIYIQAHPSIQPSSQTDRKLSLTNSFFNNYSNADFLLQQRENGLAHIFSGITDIQSSQKECQAS